MLAQNISLNYDITGRYDALQRNQHVENYGIRSLAHQATDMKPQTDKTLLNIFITTSFYNMPSTETFSCQLPSWWEPAWATLGKEPQCWGSSWLHYFSPHLWEIGPTIPPHNYVTTWGQQRNHNTEIYTENTQLSWWQLGPHSMSLSWIMKTHGISSDDRVGIMTTLGF